MNGYHINRNKAIKWWNTLSLHDKNKFKLLQFPNIDRTLFSFTGREIENIHKKYIVINAFIKIYNVTEDKHVDNVYARMCIEKGWNVNNRLLKHGLNKFKEHHGVSVDEIKTYLHYFKKHNNEYS
jgi:hypothetical protein